MIFGLVIAGGLVIVVHVARPSSGTMFDDHNFGAAVVEGAFGVIVAGASCGDPNARHHRKIAVGDHFGRDIGPLWSQSSHVLPQAGMGPSAPTDDDKNSRSLSNLSAPVCAKHTEAADPMTDVIKYSSGTLEFRSYRYYKAFCELNQIVRASAKRR
ncbi:MAG TPA: hypothetical protein VH143_18880 [Kofleriaceae bacterium]|nr:hypothetical protein [Kofleriaceae bacterium]